MFVLLEILFGIAGIAFAIGFWPLLKGAFIATFGPLCGVLLAVLEFIRVLLRAAYLIIKAYLPIVIIVAVLFIAFIVWVFKGDKK